MMVVDSNPAAQAGRRKSAWYQSAPPVGSGMAASFCSNATAILIESRHSLESGTSFVFSSQYQENWQRLDVPATLLCLITSQRLEGKRGSIARFKTTRP